MPCNNKPQPPPWPCFGVRRCGGLIFSSGWMLFTLLKIRASKSSPLGKRMCPLNQQQNQKINQCSKTFHHVGPLHHSSLSFPDSCINMFLNMPTMNVPSTWSMALASQVWWFRISARAKKSCYIPLLNRHKTTNKFAQLVFAGPVQKLGITIVLARQTCKTSGL